MSWPFQGFFEEQSTIMRSFFEDQEDEVETGVNYSYNKALNFVEEQKKKLEDDANDYIEKMKISGEKIAETWSNVSENIDDYTLENPEEILTAPAIVARNGYVCETHTVISQGYVLNIHRIPRSKDKEAVSSKVVLLQHGLFASSVDWLLNGPKKALAYVLADAGYDVWMSNIRGNIYSREHTHLKIDSESYWNFSWHDVAQHDIPAIIDYIIDVKGRNTKITYMGHSMGTTILFAMLTLRPEYNTKLTAGFALAPIVYLANIKSPIKTLAPVTSTIASMETLYKSYEFVPKNSAIGRITKSCSLESMDSDVCKNIVFYICGFNEKQFNKTLLPVFLAHLGTGTSWKTMVHFAQEISSGGKFQQFDYGSYRNIEVYGSETPYEYDLSKITLPISLFWSKNDLLSSEEDVKMLYDTLDTRKEMYMVPDPEFNHLDYIWAVNAPRLLNNKILEYLGRAFDPHVERHIPRSVDRHLRFLTLRM